MLHNLSVNKYSMVCGVSVTGKIPVGGGGLGFVLFFC